MNHKSSRQNFILLVSVSLVMFIALFFMIGNLRQSLTRELTPVHKRKMLVKVIHWANTNENHKMIQANRWMRIFIKNKPLARPQRLILTDKQMIEKNVTQLSNQMRYSIKLNDNRWLNIVFRKGAPNHFIVTSNIAIIVLLIIVLCSFYFWLVERMASPIRQLKYLADSLSHDVGRIKLVDVNVPEINAVVQAVNQLQAHIRKLMSDRTQTLAAISHDLRTPITRLKLRLEAFEGAPQFEKLMADLAEMERMIDSVLNFVKNESEEDVVKFDISALVETIINDMSDAGFAVIAESIDEKISFTGQMLALKRAFTNVIDNAIKYGGNAEITLSQEKNKIIFTVDDQGPGIEEKELEKVFEPFYRVDKSRNLNTGGSGLGLVITKNIIQQNKGEVSLRNLANGGLRAQIIFSKK